MGPRKSKLKVFKPHKVQGERSDQGCALWFAKPFPLLTFWKRLGFSSNGSSRQRGLWARVLNQKLKPCYWFSVHVHPSPINLHEDLSIKVLGCSFWKFGSTSQNFYYCIKKNMLSPFSLCVLCDKQFSSCDIWLQMLVVIIFNSQF